MPIQNTKNSSQRFMAAVFSLLTYSDSKEPIAAGIAAPIQPFIASNASTFAPFYGVIDVKIAAYSGLLCAVMRLFQIVQLITFKPFKAICE